MNRGFIGALCLSVAFALLVGCGGSQPPIGAPAMAQTSAIANHAARGKSWMLPGSSGQDLLYVSSERGNIYVYSYPRANLIGTFQTPTGGALGECVDSAGDVFVATLTLSGSSTIYEYAHGGTNPIAALSDPGWANGCAIDPTTGDLAVTNAHDPGNPHNQSGDLALYVGGKGTAIMYYPDTDEYDGFEFAVYDDQGTLYLTAGDNYHGTTDLLRFSPAGSGSFQQVSLAVKVYGYSSLIWDGKHVVVSSYRGLHQSLFLYRLRISGSGASVISTTELTTKKNNYSGQVWGQGHAVIGTDYIGRDYQDVSSWQYPKGGRPRHSIRKVGNRGAELWGVTVSVAPSH